MADFDIEALLSPIDEGAPCGANLEYDAAFLALEDAARGKPEQEFGETIIEAVEPDWRAVDEQARELFGRTKDLRIAVHWLRARTRLYGLSGFASTLPLLHGLLERYWDGVFPLLDETDNNDPTMRLNSLAPLNDPLPNELRLACVGAIRGGLEVRGIELASGKVQPEPGESAPSVDGVSQALLQAETQEPGFLSIVAASHDYLEKIETLVSGHVGAAGPDLKPLRLLTQCIAEATARATASDAADGDTTDGTGAVSTPGSLRNREDAVRMLNRVGEWIERNEPSNPAPLLIRRAQRLMSMNFMEIVRDLAPDGVGQVANIAGVTDE